MDDKKMARLLRKQGFSYTEINARLTKKRSKSTLAYWFRDIPLSEYQKANLRELHKDKLAAARVRAGEAKSAQRERRGRELTEQNAKLAELLASRDARKALLGVLYAAAGAKKTFSFASADPDLIRLYLYLLRTSFAIDETKLRATLLARAGASVSELTWFWAKETAIPVEQFYAARRDMRSIGKTPRIGASKGVCRIDYLSSDLFREVQSIGTILTSSARSHTGH